MFHYSSNRAQIYTKQFVLKRDTRNIANWTSLRQISLSTYILVASICLVFQILKYLLLLQQSLGFVLDSQIDPPKNRTKFDYLSISIYLRIQSTSIRSQTSEICSICFPSVQTNLKQSAETNSTVNVRATSSCFLIVK